MEVFRKDLFINRLCSFLDGQSLSNLSSVCRRFRQLIHGNEHFKKLIYMHHIWIDHPSQFVETILPFFQRAKGGRRKVCTVCGDGSRTIKWRGYWISFNDFYNFGNKAYHQIEDIRSIVSNYIFIEYPRLGGIDRFDLGEELGQIHRGSSIVVF